MNYIDDYGVQTDHGTQLGNLISEVIKEWIDDYDKHLPKESGQFFADLLYTMCTNESFLQRLHNVYCFRFNVYPDRYKDIPYSNKLRNQIFQIFICCANYEFARYKIVSRSKKREIDEA
ncbi:hypothetical protein 65p344 [Aeromonas phage 65]|uniref:Uncharacterized protein n=1 Tax=Aeromonas phage 65 TaxID=2919549 RepID=E5DSH8_9CAUD|nr:hypothetical protein ST65p344 [Aeromonas phage 65]ADQ53352.1 hypothetical protein 65p344 [Aeromonas phage 65]